MMRHREHTMDRREDRYIEGRNGLDAEEEKVRSIGSGVGIGVRNVSMRREGVRGFGSVLLRCELAWDGARGFRIGKGGSGMVLMAWKWHRQVGVGQIGVGMVMVVTSWHSVGVLWR